MYKKHYANQARLRRHRRVRNKVVGSTSRPRLSVFRSSQHIYAQIIDDTRGTTLVAASSRDADFAAVASQVNSTFDAESAPESLKSILENARVKQALVVGVLLAQRAKAKGIEKVVFDRGGYLYHGRVAALAAGARSGGLEF